MDFLASPNQPTGRAWGGLAVLAIAALVLAMAFTATGATVLPDQAAASSGKSACKKWGNKEPGQVKRVKLKKAILCFVNRERKARSLKKLKRVKALQSAAQRYTRHMQRTNCFSHSCAGTPDMVTRLRKAGYPGRNNNLQYAAENLAWGESYLGTPRNIVRAWMKSPGHKANILARKPRDLGVGVLKGSPSRPGSSGGTYTVNFGKRR